MWEIADHVIRNILKITPHRTNAGACQTLAVALPVKSDADMQTRVRALEVVHNKKYMS